MTRTRPAAAIAAIMLIGGCGGGRRAAAQLGVQTTATTAPAAVTTAPAAIAEPAAAAGPSAPPEAPPQTFPGQLLARQLAPLVGLTIDEARRRLVQLGHDGAVVVVVLDKFMAGCSQDQVCTYGPTFAMGVHDEIQLWINPRLAISAPSP
jgi:hypothetical protein